jgi:hypothetical protein
MSDKAFEQQLLKALQSANEEDLILLARRLVGREVVLSSATEREIIRQLAHGIHHIRYPDLWYQVVSHIVHKPEAAISPPTVAEFLLSLLLNKKSGEAAIGDLNERFEEDCRRFGAARARRIYWGRTMRSVWPLVVRLVARAIKWGVVAEALRRRFME